MEECSSDIIPVICISGPTASGKSKFAVELAKKIGGEIINADSVQVYQGFDIGSGKILDKERDGVVHHLLSHVTPNEQYSAGRFRKESLIVIEEIHARGKIPIIVGGTGLYVRALFSNFLREFDTEIAQKTLDNILNSIGEDSFINWCYRFLSCVDKNAAERIGQFDLVRLRRAVEIFLSLGIPNQEYKKIFNTRDSRICGLVLVLEEETKSLYEKINQRVLSMFEIGWISEVKEILTRYPSAVGLNAIGYRHISSFLQTGKSLEILEKSFLINNIQRDTRRFAKRQNTWWRNQPKTLGWVPYREFLANKYLEAEFGDLNNSASDMISYVSDLVFNFIKSIEQGKQKDFCISRGIEDAPVFYEGIILD